MIIQRFNLNLIPNQSPVIVHVNQYDTGTGRLIATLYEGNEPYSPSGTAVIQGTKPDGHGFQYTATLDGNVVTADLTEQMAPVAGDVRAQIVVTESSGVTGTFVFIMRVQPSALPNDTDMSESDYQYIEEAIREAQEAVETAQEATETAQEAVERAEAAITETQENAEDSEAWAQGTRGGIPVEPTDPTYEHNAEYWAQYAERYAQGGLHYKSSIPFADIPTTGMREGDMYNITDDFTTDSRFEEGAGIEVKGGTNIAWNSDNKWDVLALPPKTTFNGRSGSILPMAGDYDSRKILLSSALHIGGETQSDVQEALEALSNDGVKSFNGRSGSILPMAGDYDSEKILLSSILHIGGETQDNVQEALKALSDDGVKFFNGRSGSILPIAGDYDSEKILLTSVLHIGGETQDNVQEAIEALENNKADRVDNAIEDNFAGLDADGNLKDSGKKASDFATPSDIAGQQSLLKDTVGFTGKNRLKNTATTQTINGVTFTVNSDGSVTANGTASANASVTIATYLTLPTDIIGQNVILTGCPDGGSTNGKYFMNAIGLRSASSGDTDTGSGVQINNVYDFTSNTSTKIYIEVRSGFVANNLTFYPMLRKADITDPTYEPYHESVEVMYEEEIHGINLLKNEGTSQTINGVTFTVNADGSVAVNGTCTANYAYNVCTAANNTEGQKLRGRYIISTNVLLPNGGDFSLQKNNLSSYWDMGSSRKEMEVEFTDSEYWSGRVHIYSTAGTVWNNIRVYPMIRKAEIEDSTYRPYNYQAIQNQLNAQGVLGAKNLLSYPYDNTSKTVNGITFTDNGDGTVTINCTNSTDAGEFFVKDYFPIATSEFFKVGNIVNGISGGSIDTYNLVLSYRNSSHTWIGDQTTFDGDMVINPPSGAYEVKIKIHVSSGVTLSNVKISPMIRLASDPDDTYQPYAMTNRELTANMLTALFSHPIRLTSSDDLDNVKTAGIYEIVNSVPTNAPSGLSSTTYSALFVLRAGGSAAITQIYIQGGWRPTDKHIAIRGYGSSPLAWSAWRYITDSAS